MNSEGLAPWTRNSRTQGWEGSARFRPYPEPGETLIQLGQPTQLVQHRDIGMKHSSIHCSFNIGLGLSNRNRRRYFLGFSLPAPVFFFSGLTNR